MNLKSICSLVAYLLAGTLLIEILSEWIPFKMAFGIGMAFCFVISLVLKLKIGWILILGGLYCLLLYLDNYFSLNLISDVKQSDWITVVGSGILFTMPGIFGAIVFKLIRDTKVKFNAGQK